MSGRARIELQPGFILAARPYRDTSLLIEAWTREHGRVGLVARGARAARGKGRGLLQPHRPLLLSWIEGGDLGTLTGVEASAPGIELPGEAVFCGWYVSELLLRLLARHDPHPALFDAYAGTLAALAADAEAALRGFEKRLLAELGYGLDLPGDLLATAWYRYDADQGLLRVEAQAPQAIRGASLIDLRDDRYGDAQSRRDARRLLRELLRRQLGERELASARLLRQMRRFRQRPA